MKTIGYIRVSTEDQAENGYGLAAQKAAIRKAFGEPEAWFDDDMSGSRADRPGLRKALDSLKAGDQLVVAKRDRLARDVMLSCWIEKEVKRREAVILSAAGEGTGDDKPESVLMRRLIDAFAEFERAMIRLRTTSALAEKRKRGEKLGGRRPFGWSVTVKDGKKMIVVDEREQKIIAEMVEMRRKGAKLSEIRKALHEAGIKTATGRDAWNEASIFQIIEKAKKRGKVNDGTRD
ncbi:MAG: recombinase family protein [Pseudomonadota bacterium]